MKKGTETSSHFKSNSESCNEESEITTTPLGSSISNESFIAKFSDNIPEVLGLYNDKKTLKDCFKAFSKKTSIHYDTHLENFFKNDPNECIKNALKDKDFLNEVIEGALANKNSKLVTKIVDLVTEKKNLSEIKLTNEPSPISPSNRCNLVIQNRITALAQKKSGCIIL
jgi:hypothetical protein